MKATGAIATNPGGSDGKHHADVLWSEPRDGIDQCVSLSVLAPRSATR